MGQCQSVAATPSTTTVIHKRPLVKKKKKQLRLTARYRNQTTADTPTTAATDVLSPTNHFFAEDDQLLSGEEEQADQKQYQEEDDEDVKEEENADSDQSCLGCDEEDSCHPNPNPSDEETTDSFRVLQVVGTSKFSPFKMMKKKKKKKRSGRLGRVRSQLQQRSTHIPAPPSAPTAVERPDASVSANIVSDFDRLRLQLQVHQQEQQKQARHDKREDRLADVQQYRKLYKEFQRLQRAEQDHCASDDEHSILSLQDSDSWFFDFGAVDFSNTSSRQQHGDTISLHSESSLKMQKDFFRRKRRERKKNKKKSKKTSVEKGEVFTSIAGQRFFAPDEEPSDYGPPSRKKRPTPLVVAGDSNSVVSDLEDTSLDYGHRRRVGSNNMQQRIADIETALWNLKQQQFTRDKRETSSLPPVSSALPTTILPPKPAVMKYSTSFSSGASPDYSNPCSEETPQISNKTYEQSPTPIDETPQISNKTNGKPPTLASDNPTLESLCNPVETPVLDPQVVEEVPPNTLSLPVLDDMPQETVSLDTVLDRLLATQVPDDESEEDAPTVLLIDLDDVFDAIRDEEPIVGETVLQQPITHSPADDDDAFDVIRDEETIPMESMPGGPVLNQPVTHCPVEEDLDVADRERLVEKTTLVPLPLAETSVNSRLVCAESTSHAEVADEELTILSDNTDEHHDAFEQELLEDSVAPARNMVTIVENDVDNCELTENQIGCDDIDALDDFLMDDLNDDEGETSPSLITPYSIPKVSPDEEQENCVPAAKFSKSEPETLPFDESVTVGEVPKFLTPETSSSFQPAPVISTFEQSSPFNPVIYGMSTEEFLLMSETPSPVDIVCDAEDQPWDEGSDEEHSDGSSCARSLELANQLHAQVQEVLTRYRSTDF